MAASLQDSLLFDCAKEGGIVCRAVCSKYPFLRRVASLSSVNMMQAHNLGIVFGPTLLRVEAGFLAVASILPTHGVVVELLISHHDEIFVK